MDSPSTPPARALPEATSQAILAALPAHVALLDAAGVIRHVNEAWVRFARHNGWDDPRAGLGTSYLAVCDAAVGAAEDDGHAVGAGLRDVLEGREPSFEYEYPCHAPSLERWFRLVATPAQGSWNGAVVMHIDVTERRLIEDALRETAGQLRNAQRLAGLGYFHMDLPHGGMTFADETLRMLGCDAGELPDWASFISHVHRKEQLPLAAGMEGLLDASGSLDTQVRFFRPDGTVRWLRIRAEAIRPASTRGRIAGTLLDITERRAAGEAIRASEERSRRLAEQLRDTLENMPDGFFTLDREWRVTYLNRASEQLAGGSREQFIGRVLWDMFPEEEAMFRPHYQRALDDQRAVEFEAFSPLLGIWTEMRAFPTRGGLGVYFRDVTRRRGMEEELRASRERFARVADVTADAIYDWDIAGGEVWRSQGMERLFGVRAGSSGAEQDLWVERLHPEERCDVLARIQRAHDSDDASWSGEYRFRRADGSYAWVADRASIVRDAAGRAVRMVGGMSDISGERSAREQLEEQARLLDNARDAIHVRDLEHRVQYLNRSAEQLYGWSAGEALGRSIQSLLHRDAGAFHRAVDHLLTHGEWNGEMEKTTRDGRQLIVQARWTLLRDAQGVPRRILAIDMDVTERRQLEQQLIRSQRLDSIGTLAGGIAHDLNNVLTPILMAANLLEASGAEEAALVQAIRTSAARGVDMIGQIMSFARGAGGERVPVFPGDVVEGVLPIVSETFPKDIVVETQVAPGLPPVLGDATQLHQVLLNLAVNARDAMPRGGRLRIAAHMRLEPLNGALQCVAFDVEDWGTGISPEHVEKLWDPFFTTKAPGHGTGLGLPTSLAIVKAHGGQIRVRSRVGHGSCFTVLLPAAAEAESAAAEADSASVEPAEGSPPRGDGRHVLVVDDEASIRAITRRVLESHGYGVDEVADGAQALAACRRRAYDVVLMDLMMPVMDGATAIEELLSLDPGAPLLATSGFARPEHMAVVGARKVPFLAKPYTPGALLRAVAAARRA